MRSCAHCKCMYEASQMRGVLCVTCRDGRPTQGMKYDSYEAGMRITIGVRCMCCEDGYLNTPTVEASPAKACAESMGWRFDEERGWLCSWCADGRE